MSHFVWFLVTPHFASFLSELGHKLKTESARCFRTERFKGLKSVRKHVIRKYYSESLPQLILKFVTPHLWISILIDFELNKSSDPLAKNGNKFIETSKASMTKLK